jgi:hypothetical protein
VDTGKPVKATILVKDLERDDAKIAPLDIWTDDDGYFTIPMLKVGGHYELIARAKEGNDVISQRVFVQPPKPNLLLRLDKRFTTGSTPKIPDMPDSSPRKRNSSGSDSSSDRTSAVIVEPPEKLPSEPPTGGTGTNPASDSGSGSNSGSGTAPNPSNIAREEFPRIPQSPTVVVPPVPRLQSPSWDNVPDSRQPTQPPAVPRSPGSVNLPDMPTLVPSCGFYGEQLDNFALYDIDGKVWEYRRKGRGHLVLLDFWYHTCGPCLSAIPHLVSLQNDFGPYGLEVVSIACETGPIEEQRQIVRNIRSRYHINYTALLSGGGPGRCPVIKQFQVEYYPVLILIDTDGHFLWRSSREGMDDFAHERLRRKIQDRLVRQQQP